VTVSSLRCAEGGSAPATECDPVPGNAYAAMASAIASATRTARSLSRGSTRTTPPAPRSPPRAALSLARERFAEKRASGSRPRPVVRRSCLRPEAIAGLARGVLLSMQRGHGVGAAPIGVTRQRSVGRVSGHQGVLDYRGPRVGRGDLTHDFDVRRTGPKLDIYEAGIGVARRDRMAAGTEDGPGAHRGHCGASCQGSNSTRQAGAGQCSCAHSKKLSSSGSVTCPRLEPRTTHGRSGSYSVML
jgi:hypothetical protein